MYSNTNRIVIITLSLAALILILLTIEYNINKWLTGFAFSLISLVFIIMAKGKDKKNTQ